MDPFLFPDLVTNPALAREGKGDGPQALAQLFWWRSRMLSRKPGGTMGAGAFS